MSLTVGVEAPPNDRAELEGWLRRRRCGLTDPEPKLTTDSEAAGPATLAAQVIDGLDTDPELQGELRHRHDGMEPVLRG
jgi:hypothetical protein